MSVHLARGDPPEPTTYCFAEVCVEVSVKADQRVSRDLGDPEDDHEDDHETSDDHYAYLEVSLGDINEQENVGLTLIHAPPPLLGPRFRPIFGRAGGPKREPSDSHTRPVSAQGHTGSL